MPTVIEGVEVTMGRHSEDWRKVGITVKVWSQKKRHLKATNEIDPGTVGTAQAVIQLVGAAGGACAEYLGKRYKDNIDPSKAATAAMRAFVEEVRMSKELSATVPEKLARIRGQAHRLKNNEQELIERCHWFVTHQQTLTPGEVAAIDAMVARLHEVQL